MGLRNSLRVTNDPEIVSTDERSSVHACSNDLPGRLPFHEVEPGRAYEIGQSGQGFCARDLLNIG